MGDIMKTMILKNFQLFLIASCYAHTTNTPFNSNSFRFMDLFNDGSIGDPVDVSSEVSLEPTVKPPVPEPVEIPTKRNDDLDRFKSDRFSLLSFATGNNELALQKLRALKENAAKLNALRKMDKLYGNGKK